MLSYGIASDARGAGRWDRDGGGLERAVRMALERAGWQPGDVASVWTSAAGLRSADEPEAAALTRVFGDAPARFAPKRLLGEPMGAGGAVSAVLAAMSLQRGHSVGPALVTSSSLGGTHIAVLLAAPH